MTRCSACAAAIWSRATHGRALVSCRQGNLADLLDVEMHQLAGRSALIAVDRRPNGTAHRGGPIQLVTLEHPPDCRGGHPGAARQIHRAALGAAPRPAGKIPKTRLALSAPSASPLHDRAPRQAHLAATSAWVVPASIRVTGNGRPASVKRALALDIEPPGTSVVVVANTTLAQEAQPITLPPTSVSTTARY